MMSRVIPIVLAILFAAAPLVAQGTAGWKVRADRSTSAADPDAAGDIKFMAMGAGFHAINPQAAVYWKPGSAAKGAYTLGGRFTLLKPSDHTNYYGLVFGGSDLEGPKQSYIYFLVAQDGTFLIKRRNGDATSDVKARESSPAVRRPNPNGQSTNDLEIRVRPDTISFSVNGTTVHTMPRSALPASADGLYGFRINHRLEVMVENLGVS